MSKKKDWEIGNYFYDKRRAEGTLKHKQPSQFDLVEAWNTIVVLFWFALIFVIIYIKAS